MSNDLLENNEDLDELNFILRSEIKLKILTKLFEENSSIEKLKEMGINYGSLLSNLKQLTDNGSIYKIDNEYALSNTMRMKVANLLYMNNVVEKIDVIKDYLNSHLVKYDELETLSEIPIAKEHEIIYNTPLNPYKVVQNFSNNMAANGNVKCIFTHIHPEFQIVNRQDADYNTELDILVAKELKEYLIYEKQRHVGRIPLKNRHVKIKTIKPIKLSLVVTESEVMIVLYNKDGTYDTNTALISHDLHMIKFGNRIFDELASYSNDEYIDLNLL